MGCHPTPLPFVVGAPLAPAGFGARGLVHEHAPGRFPRTRGPALVGRGGGRDVLDRGCHLRDHCRIGKRRGTPGTAAGAETTPTRGTRDNHNINNINIPSHDNGEFGNGRNRDTVGPTTALALNQVQAEEEVHAWMRTNALYQQQQRQKGLFLSLWTVGVLPLFGEQPSCRVMTLRRSLDDWPRLTL